MLSNNFKGNICLHIMSLGVRIYSSDSGIQISKLLFFCFKPLSLLFFPKGDSQRKKESNYKLLLLYVCLHLLCLEKNDLHEIKKLERL